MKHFKKLMCAAVSAVMLIVLMCGCGNQSDTEEDNSQYDYLKDEIVGIWMQEGGNCSYRGSYFRLQLSFL